MPSEWYVRKGDSVGGPFSKKQLTALAAKGRLTPTTQVRSGESGVWRSACDIPGLFPWIDEVRPTSPTAAARKAAAPPPTEAPASPPKTGGLSRNVVIGIAAGVALLGMLCMAGVVGVVAWLFYWRGSAASTPEPVGPVAMAPAGSNDVRPLEALPQFDFGDARDDMVGGNVNIPPADDNPPPPAVAAVEPIVAPEIEIPDIAPAPADAPDEPRAQVVDAGAVPETPQIEPKLILPAVPAEKEPIEDREITEMFRRVRLERKSADAYALCAVFAQSYAFTEEQQKRVDAEVAEFKARADQDLYRLGTDWVPLAEVEQAEQEADQLITRSAALIEVGSFKECIEFLEDASRTNPNGIRADYILGLIYSLPFAGIHGPEFAERHFRKVLARQPDHPGALNSLAIAQIKQRDFNSAVTNLSRAAELSENCQEVSQNLGRFIFLVQSGRVAANKGVVKRFSDLYSGLIADNKAQPFSDRKGWLHTVPVFPTDERNRKDPEAAPVAPAKLELVPYASGSGFVIAPELVITNRHVVYDEKTSLGIADAVAVIDPRDPAGKRELLGSVVAVSDETDLALVRFGGLPPAPLAVHGGGIDLASEVLILGYPVTDQLGNGLKATKGVVAGLPDESRKLAGDCYLFDAKADHGNSGGPILGKDGRVVAVLTFGLRPMNTEFTGGVTGDAVLQFAVEHIPDFDADAAADNREFADWAEMTKVVSPSVLKLKTYYKAGEPSLAIAANRAKASGNIYEDRTCPTCTGMGRLACAQKGCVRGQVAVKYFDTAIGGVPPNTYVIRVEKSRKETCPTCKGRGWVDCPDCRGGLTGR